MIVFYFMTAEGVEEIEVPARKALAIEAYLDEVGAISLGGNAWSLEGFE